MSQRTEFPFQVALGWVPPTVPAEQNRTFGLKGASRYEPVGDAIERMEEQRSANEDRCASWFEHPDRRVVAAALPRMRSFDWTSNTRYFGRGYYRSERRLRRVLERAIAEADEAGVLWSTLLDSAHPLREIVDGKEGSPFKGRLAQVREWVETCAEPASLERLYDAFERAPIPSIIARHAGHYTPALTKQLGQDLIESLERYEARTQRAATPPYRRGRRTAPIRRPDVPDLVDAALTNPRTPPTLLETIADRWGEMPTIHLRLLDNPATPRTVWLRLAEAVDTRRHPQGLGLPWKAALTTRAGPADIESRLRTLMAANGGLRAIDERLTAERPPEHLDAVGAAFAADFLRTYISEEATAAWRLMAEAEGWLKARLEPPGDWAARAFRAFRLSAPLDAFEALIEETHPWVRDLPGDRREWFLDTYEAAFEHRPGAVTRHTRDREHPLFEEVGPAGTAERDAWIRWADRAPADAVYALVDPTEEDAWIDRLPPSDFRGLFRLDPGAKVQLQGRTLRDLFRRRPDLLVHPDLRGPVTEYLEIRADDAAFTEEFLGLRRQFRHTAEERAERSGTLQAFSAAIGKNRDDVILTDFFLAEEEPDVDGALGALDDPAFVRHARLSRAALVPLLEHEDREVRQAAITRSAALHEPRGRPR